jgi:hypothetical protein
MSTSVNSEPRVLLCDHCQAEINRDPRNSIFVVARKSTVATYVLEADNSLPAGAKLPNPADPDAPFACSLQRADFLVSDEELVFGSIVCVKKWLLKWVDTAVALRMKVGRV